MKELKLKALALSGAEMLTKAQMKNVLGGKEMTISCTWSGSCSGVNAFPSTSYDSGDSQGATIVQNAMDDWCGGHDCCSDVDCAGAN